MHMSLPPDVEVRATCESCRWLSWLWCDIRTRGCSVLSHRASWHTVRVSSDKPTKLMVSYYLSAFDRFHQLLGFPSLRHNRRCDCGGSNNTHQYVFNTRKRCIRSRSRPRVHHSPHSANPSTTPIHEQHHPMETVRGRSRGVCTIHVCYLQSPSQNNMPAPSLYQQRSTRLCKTRRWNHPDRHDTLRSDETPPQGFHIRKPRFAPS